MYTRGSNARVCVCVSECCICVWHSSCRSFFLFQLSFCLSVVCLCCLRLAINFCQLSFVQVSLRALKLGIIGRLPFCALFLFLLLFVLMSCSNSLSRYLSLLKIIIAPAEQRSSRACSTRRHCLYFFFLCFFFLIWLAA